MMSPPSVIVDLPTATTISGKAVSVQINRGRTAPVFEDIDAGECSAVLNNQAREFDPLYSSGSYYGDVVPGATVTVQAGGDVVVDASGVPVTDASGNFVYTTSPVTIYTGVIDDWGYDYDVSTRSTAFFSAVDSLAVLGRTDFDEWTSTYGQLPGARLTSILARPEVNYTGATSFNTGATYLNSDLVTWGSNVLNYCQLVAATDMGLFFAAKNGTLTFIDRLAFISASVAVAFGGAGIGFSGIATSYGRDLLFNRVTVERIGGEPQTVSDATSITTYKRTNSKVLDGLLMQDDTQALDLATRLLAVYKDPLYRIEALEVNVHALSGADQTSVLGLDIGSVVSVTWTPNGVGTAITRTCVVEGVSHSIVPAEHTVRLTLNDSSIYQTGDFYTTEDATFGTINGAGTFSYPIAF